MTLAQFKKDLHIGMKMRLIERFGKPEDQEKEVCHIQSNSFAFKKGDKMSWLQFPPASLTEYDGKTLKIYSSGIRDLMPEEANILANRPRDLKQEEIDMMTDGSTCYWRDKQYFKSSDAEWYWGWSRGLRYSRHDNKMYDKSIKGEVELVYEIINKAERTKQCR